MLIVYWKKQSTHGGHMQEECITRFIGIPDYKPVKIYFLDKHENETDSDLEVEKVVIQLARVTEYYTCECGRRFDSYYDMREQFVRDLPWGAWNKVYLFIPRFRVNCCCCGIKTEHLEYLVRQILF